MSLYEYEDIGSIRIEMERQIRKRLEPDADCLSVLHMEGQTDVLSNTHTDRHRQIDTWIDATRRYTDTARQIPGQSLLFSLH